MDPLTLSLGIAIGQLPHHVFGAFVSEALIDASRRVIEKMPKKLTDEIFEAFRFVIEELIGKELFEFLKKKAEKEGIRKREDIVKAFEEYGLSKEEAEKCADKVIFSLPEKVAKRLSKLTFGNLLLYVRDEVRRIERKLEEVEKKIEITFEKFEDYIRGLEKTIPELEGLLEYFKALDTYMPFDAYIKSREEEISEMKKYEFIPRKIEGKDWLEWFNEAFKENVVVAIFGDGGIGKTRLALEFAEKVIEQGLEVYVFNHYAEYKEPSEMKNALVILDDVDEHVCEKVLNFCLGLSGKVVENVKVLILGRNYFRKSFERLIEESGRYFKVKGKFKSIELEKDEDALRKLLKNLGIEDKVDKIIETSLGIFYYAIVLTEYYKESGKYNLESALKWKFNTYLDELTELIKKEYGERYGRGQILDHLRLLSLVQPLKKGDLKVLRGIVDWDFPINVDETLFKVLRKEGKGFIFEEGGGISIKPDPLADYIRFEWFKEEKDFEKVVFELLKFIPYRVSRNIYDLWQIILSKIMVDAKRVVEGYDAWTSFLKLLRMKSWKLYHEHIKLLVGIWKNLNEKIENNEEYFDALWFFTYNLQPIVVKNIEYANVEEWIGHNHEYIQYALVNLLGCYFEVLKKLEVKLDELNKDEAEKNIKCFYEKVKNKIEVCLKCLKNESLAKGLTNASYIYAITCDLKKLDECLKKQKTLKKEFEEEYKKTLIFAVIGYINANYEGVEDILEELKFLDMDYYAKGLRNAVTCYARTGRFKEAEQHLITFLETSKKLNEAEYLSAVNNIILHYSKKGKIEDVRKWIDKIVDFKHEEVAKALLNAIHSESDLKRIEEYIFKLNKLDYPIYTAEALTIAILRFINLKSLRSIDRFEGVFEKLKYELEKLKKEDIVEAYKLAEIISKASFNAVEFYSERGEFERAERYAELAEGIFKPSAVDSYSMLYNEAVKRGLDKSLFYLLKAYKLNEELIEEIETTLKVTDLDNLKDELDKAKELMDKIKYNLQRLIIRNLKSPNMETVRDTISLTMKVFGKEKAKKLLLEMASLDDVAWERVYNFFKIRSSNLKQVF